MEYFDDELPCKGPPYQVDIVDVDPEDGKSPNFSPVVYCNVSIVWKIIKIQ